MDFSFGHNDTYLESDQSDLSFVSSQSDEPKSPKHLAQARHKVKIYSGRSSSVSDLHRQ